MKQPKTQQELLQLLTEQDQRLAIQDKQIHTLKQALLRLEGQLRRVAKLSERVSGAHQRLNERVKVAEHVLKDRNG